MSNIEMVLQEINAKLDRESFNFDDLKDTPKLVERS